MRTILELLLIINNTGCVIIIIRVLQKGYLLVSQLWLLFQKRALIGSHIIKTWTYIVGAEAIFRISPLPQPINAPLNTGL